jgi:hypothetical protein
VQEKAIRQIGGLKGKTYTERCRELDLETLAKRRFMQDMSQTFKIVKNIDKTDRDKVFLQQRDERACTRARANPWNIKKKFANTETRLNSFGLRVVDGWNSLPNEIKEVERLSVFKKKLRKAVQ